MNDIVKDKSGGTVARVTEALRERVRALPEGTRLVAEPLLAQELNISRSTLRTVLAILHREGLIDRAPRRGTIVSRPKKTRPISVCVISPFGGRKMGAGFNSEVFRGITQHAAEGSVDVSFLLGSIGSDVTPRTLKLVGAEHYDGVLVFEFFEKRVAEALKERAHSVVFVDYDATETGLTSVCFDNRSAAMALTDALMDLGHERFAFLGPRLGGPAWGDPALIDRLRGVMDVVSRRKGLFLAQHILSTTSKDMKVVLAPILDVRPSERPTAVIAAMQGSVSLFHEAHKQGLLRVPEDVSVVAFGAYDDRFHDGRTWGGAYFDGAQMGKRALEVLRSQIIDETPPGRLVLEGYRIDLGETATPPKRT